MADLTDEMFLDEIFHSGSEHKFARITMHACAEERDLFDVVCRLFCVGLKRAAPDGAIRYETLLDVRKSLRQCGVRCDIDERCLFSGESEVIPGPLLEILALQGVRVFPAVMIEPCGRASSFMPILRDRPDGALCVACTAKATFCGSMADSSMDVRVPGADSMFVVKFVPEINVGPYVLRNTCSGACA
jgi:hypothetical protein